MLQAGSAEEIAKEWLPKSRHPRLGHYLKKVRLPSSSKFEEDYDNATFSSFDSSRPRAHARRAPPALHAPP